MILHAPVEKNIALQANRFTHKRSCACVSLCSIVRLLCASVPLPWIIGNLSGSKAAEAISNVAAARSDEEQNPLISTITNLVVWHSMVRRRTYMVHGCKKGIYIYYIVWWGCKTCSITFLRDFVPTCSWLKDHPMKHNWIYKIFAVGTHLYGGFPNQTKFLYFTIESHGFGDPYAGNPHMYVDPPSTHINLVLPQNYNDSSTLTNFWWCLGIYKIK